MSLVATYVQMGLLVLAWLVYRGELYRSYRRQVPSLVLLPWRYLTRQRAREWMADTSAEDTAGWR